MRCLLFLSAILLAGCGQSAANREAGPLTFETPHREVRAQDLQGDHRLVLSLKNNSRQPVTIKRAETSCTCTVIDTQWPRTIAPDSTEEIQVTLSVPAYGRTVTQVHVMDEHDQVAATQSLVLIGDERPVPYSADAFLNAELTSESPTAEAVQEITFVSYEKRDASPWVLGWSLPAAVDWLVLDMQQPPTEMVVNSDLCCRIYTVAVRAIPPTNTWSQLPVICRAVLSQPGTGDPPQISVRARCEFPVKWFPETLILPELHPSSDRQTSNRTAVLRVPRDMEKHLEQLEMLTPDWVTTDFAERIVDGPWVHLPVHFAMDSARWQSAGGQPGPFDVRMNVSELDQASHPLKVHVTTFTATSR